MTSSSILVNDWLVYSLIPLHALFLLLSIFQNAFFDGELAGGESSWWRDDCKLRLPMSFLGHSVEPFFFFANHLQLDELDTWGLAFFLILYFVCNVKMEVSFTETLDSPYICHYKTRQWYILIRFCALKLILSKTLWLINPDGKCRNSLRQLGLSPLWQSINTFVVSCPVSYDFVDG